MTAVFEKILEMSLMAALVIVVVLFIRLCLRKAPRKYSYALWSVAAFRLVCPVSFKAFFSLFTVAKRLEELPMEQPAASPAPMVSPGYFDSVPPGYTPSVDVDFDPDLFTQYPIDTPPVVETPVAEPINWLQIAAVVWLIGLAALLIYGIVSYARLRRRMDTAVLAGGNVRYSDRVQSPFILGFVRPKIYLPFGLSEDQQRYVLAHERYHLKRFDHIVRPLSFLILAVHWFNPLVWLAYYLMSRDMEMSCDEKVLSTGDNIRRAYSTTLLSFAANRRFPSPSPLAFGESGVKGRIKNALNWKKPRTWVTVIAVIVCIVVIVVCAANPKDTVRETVYGITSTTTADDLDAATLGGDEMDASKLTESERSRLAELLNLVQPDELGRKDVEGISPGSGQLWIGFPWGGLVWEDGQLYIGWIDGEGGSVNAYRFLEVDNDELTAYVVNTLGGLREPLPDYTNPDDWARAIRAKHVDWAELMVNGENPLYRSLTDSELEGLLLLLNNGGVTFSAPDPNGAWAFPTERMVTICCGGVEYKLNLGPDPMTVICKDERVDWKGEDTWFVNSDSLKHYIRQLPEQTDVAEELLTGCTTYVSVKCVYQYSAVSAIMPDDSGKTYLIGKDLVAVFDKEDNDAGEFYPNPPSWKSLSEEEWNELFWEGFEPDTGGCEDIRICRLSGEYALLDLDGTIWSLQLTKLPNGMGYQAFLAYELAPVTAADPAEPEEGYYQSVECVYQTPISSTLATADSGYYYLLQGDELRLVNKQTGAGYTGTADGEWQELSEEVLHKMEWGTLVIGEIDLWDTLRERQPMLRLYGEDMLLLNFGYELWMGIYRYDRNGYISLSSAYRLEQTDGSFRLPTEQLAVWHADLTHDGVDETITVNRRVDGYEVVYYGLDIHTADGTSVWNAEFDSWDTGWNGYYLYERAGKHYLLEWYPYCWQGWYNFDYRLYRLSDTAEPEIVEEDSLIYDLTASGYWDKILTVDTEPLRAFEKKIDALLKDAQILLVDGSDGMTVGDPEAPVSETWTSPADEWEQQKISSREWFLAVHNADLTHDGVDEIITLASYDENQERYVLRVMDQTGAILWQGEAATVHAGEAGFYLYQRNGKHYLMQWNPYASTGGYWYRYEVFSLTDKGDIIPLVSNTMEFTVINEADLLELDISALRTFEQEVNGLLKDTVLLLSTYGGNPRYSTETAPICQLWDSMADDWEQRQQEVRNSMVRLAVWQADLTHDGSDESIVLTEMAKGERYLLTVCNKEGTVIWMEEANTFHVGWNGVYLYERDGKEYLMTWVPYGSTGIFDLRYQVFSLTEKGEQIVLASNFFEFAAMNEEQMLNVDVAALRQFEDEVNTLLSDSFVLIDTDNATPVYSTENNRITRLWAGLSDYVEGMQRNIMLAEAMSTAGIKISCEQIDSVEIIDPDIGGTSRGVFVYRVQYRLAYNEDAETCYVVMEHVWEDVGQSERHTPMAVLTEAELQQYNTEEILKQYDYDLYRAAAQEIYRNYHKE